MSIEAECQMCGHTFEAPEGAVDGMLVKCPACGEEDGAYVGQEELPPLEAYSEEQRKLIARCLWPASAMNAAIAERDSLADVIDRAADALPHDQTIDRLNRIIFRLPNSDALDLAELFDGVKAAKMILAEPRDREPGNG